MELEYYSESLRLIGIVFGTVFLVAIIYLVKIKKLQERYSLIWFFIAGFILLISVFKGFIEWFSGAIGIYYAPSAFFAIMILCAYFILLNNSIILSTVRKQNKSLIQEIGLIKLKIEEAGCKAETGADFAAGAAGAAEETGEKRRGGVTDSLSDSDTERNHDSLRTDVHENRRRQD